MKPCHTFKLACGVVLLACSGLVAASAGNSPKAYQDTRKLLSAMSSPHLDRDKLAALFRVGDQRLADLIEALDDPSPEIRLRAQIVIRYVGDNAGMRALYRWYEKRQQFSVAGPIPLPLSEYDYRVIYANYVGKPPQSWSETERYIYALALDGSPRATSALGEIIESAGGLGEATFVGSALRRVQVSHPAMPLTGGDDSAKLVQSNAFFIAPKDRKYTSTRLLAFNGAKNKALVEVYINRGALSEEWYHVVLEKRDEGWKFFSVTPVAKS